MAPRFVRLLAAGLIMAPAVLAAQKKGSPVARFTPYVGYMAFGDLASGPLGSRIANQAAPIYGAQLGINLTPNIALVGNLGYSDSNVQVGLPIVGGLSIAQSKTVLYDGAIQLRLPALSSSLGTGVVPFVEGGAGAIHYEVHGGPITTKSTNLALNYGGGLDLQVNRSFGLRLMAKDYVGKFDFKEATGFNFTGSTAHNLMFAAGLNLGF